MPQTLPLWQQRVFCLLQLQHLHLHLTLPLYLWLRLQQWMRLLLLLLLLLPLLPMLPLLPPLFPLLPQLLLLPLLLPLQRDRPAPVRRLQLAMPDLSARVYEPWAVPRVRTAPTLARTSRRGGGNACTAPVRQSGQRAGRGWGRRGGGG
jgi:hypothetical protein